MTRQKREMVRGLTSAKCIQALRGRYKAPEYALFEQVANGTGFGVKGWADAVAMGIWPSRGLEVHGFEVKVDRHDWKRELENPAKAENVQRFCDRWFIVAPAGMLDAEELPPTWGLLEVSEKLELRAKVQAPKLDAQPLTKTFVAAVLRRHSEQWDAALKEERRLGKEEGAQNGHGDLAKKLARAEEQYRTLREKCALFEDKSGIHIEHSWNLGNVADAVRLLTQTVKRDSLLEQLRRDEAAYAHRLERLREDIEALEGVKTPEAAE